MQKVHTPNRLQADLKNQEEFARRILLQILIAVAAPIIPAEYVEDVVVQRRRVSHV